jgi:hypothetical protein
LRTLRATLLIDPRETTLWAICAERNFRSQARTRTNETVVAFGTDGSGIAQRADITGHQLAGWCFLDGMLITAGWDATIRFWDARQPMPFAAVSGSSPFRCVDAAGDRVVAGDQRGNVWFLAPMHDLYA